LALNYKLSHERYNKISKDLYLKEKKELLNAEKVNSSPIHLKNRIKNSMERAKRELSNSITRTDDAQSVLSNF
jgi:hypothetical protein